MRTKCPFSGVANYGTVWRKDAGKRGLARGWTSYSDVNSSQESGRTSYSDVNSSQECGRTSYSDVNSSQESGRTSYSNVNSSQVML